MNKNESAAALQPLNVIGWVALAVASGISLAGLISVATGNEVAILALIFGLAIFTFGIGMLAASRR